MWKNIAVSDRSKMAIQYCVRALYAGYHGCKHTAASICNIYCSSTATGAARTRLSITLRYTHIAFHISKIPNLLTYLLTPWSRVLLEKLTSKLCS